MTDRAPFLQRVAWRLQAWAARALVALIRLLPFAVASNLGGFLGRVIGPRVGISRRAWKNIHRALPDKTDGDIDAIVRGMWDNLGRLLFEVPHLDRLKVFDKHGPFEVVGLEHFEALRDDGKPGLFLSAHFGNWELGGLVSSQGGMDLHQVYRAPNNPYMKPFFEGRPGTGNLIPKGAQGAREIIRLLGDGGHVGLMVDQKMNDGIAVPFFGRDAMTAPALAQFALKFDCPIVPVRFERAGGARFRVTFYPPLPVTDSGDKQADILDTMTRVNQVLEGWIRERPEQWLWLHNRWPD